MKFMFELLIDGTIERMADFVMKLTLPSGLVVWQKWMRIDPGRYLRRTFKTRIYLSNLI